MEKVRDVFNFSKNIEFLRIIISDNKLFLKHIKNNKLTHKIDSAFIEKEKVFKYIRKHFPAPLEIIIASNTASYRTISLNNLREKDMLTIVNGIIGSKNGAINLACYERKISYKQGKALLCDMKLTQAALAIIREVLSIGNPIIATTAWPFWIVSSYFSIYPMEKEKFRTPIFIIKTKSSWEIIALHDERYIYYRGSNTNAFKEDTEEFNEKMEIDNAIKSISQLRDINSDDIAIYYVDEKTIDTFTAKSSINMKIVSNSEKFDRINKTAQLNFGIKTACLLIFSALFANTIINITDAFSYNRKINNIKKSISILEPDILNEISIWEPLSDYICVNHLDFKAKLAKKMRNTDRKLKNISIKINEKTKQTFFNVVYEK